MTTLLESKAKPFGSSKGALISLAIHGVVIAAAVFTTAQVVLPPREKVEEHPILYVATPPPKPIEPPPAPLPKAPPAPAKAKEVFKAPPQKRAPQPERPRPVPQVQPKGPTTPALVAPSKVALNIPAIDVKAPPTVSDVVAPPVADVVKSSGISSGGSVKRDEGSGSGSGGGLGSGSAGKAYDENQVDRPVAMTRPLEPRYPDALKSVGVQGTVLMHFIVSADGRVEPGSIEVVSSPHKLFSDAVRQALLSARFRPAEAGGTKVRQLVEQSFTFRIS
ncbi:MAG: TonB family protein [Gemmatimonadetes bacterium]|jgi:protein TonB|nr:TonB family protein [Gemmatimonadota bacterium]